MIPQNNDLEQFGDERPILKQIREEQEALEKMIAHKMDAHQRHWPQIQWEIKAQQEKIDALIRQFNRMDETE